MIGKTSNLLLAAVLFLALLALGVAGYMGIEGWSFLDALYMTITTVATVGFGEVHPLSDTGQVFTIFLILGGVSVFFYGFVNMVGFVLEGELTTALGGQRMKIRIESLKGHDILCGFGRVGEEIAKELKERGAAFIVVDSNPDAIARARARNYLVVEGDATRDEVLRNAGVERAHCLMAASDSDAGNTFIVLAAKALNPALLVISRAAQSESVARMLQAGAARVISPYSITGRRMALSALQPMLADFADALANRQQHQQILAEIEITANTILIAKTVAELIKNQPGATVLGLQKSSGETIVGPRGDTPLEAADRLIILTEKEAIGTIIESAASVDRSRGGG